MHILFVLAHFQPYIGGAETLFLRLAEWLVSKGHTVRVVTLKLPNTSNFEVINGIEIERIRVPSFFPAQYAYSIFALPKIVKLSRNFDLIHTTSNYSALPGWIAAHINRKPIIITCCEVLGERWRLVEPNLLKAWSKRIAEKLVIKLNYNMYVAISDATLKDLWQIGINPDNTCRIYCGIDDIYKEAEFSTDNLLRKLCEMNKSDFLYLYFGRSGITKGVDYLINAAPLISKEIPNTHLVLILGKEPKENYLRLIKLIKTVVLHNKVNIHVVPSVPDKKRLVEHLLSANCVVIPSITEGFGLSAAEACTLGIPVVASRVGSIPEVISGKYVLIEPASSEAICKGVVRSYYGKYDPWIDSQNFSWKKMSDDYESIYQILVSDENGIKVNS
jgi:D-inositol-3-phosphate glycosyltransferase